MPFTTHRKEIRHTSLMEQSAKDTWKRLLDQARNRLPEPTLRTWLEPAEAVSLEDGKLVVATPDQFAAEWNESKQIGRASCRERV